VIVRTAIGESEPPSPDVLEELRHIVRDRAELERHEAALVRRARNQGIVWEQIAACLAVSKQAVHKKYAAGTLRRR
jgi:hypothetical protein